MNTPSRHRTSVQQRLLGYDVRELWMDGDLWDRSRREVFLLRTEVAKPLSVDPIVWPSVFDTGQGIGLPDPERRRLGLAGIPTPPWTGANAGLWKDLDAMKNYLAENWANPQPNAVIAVSWFSNRYFTDAGKVGPYVGETVPPIRNSEWAFLGFDVADGSLVSGLTNCGYTEPEARDLRADWQVHLNDHHLLVELAEAFRFRELANERIREHAPFFVFGLHLVEGQGFRV